MIYSVAILALNARYQAQPYHSNPDLDPLLQVILIALLDRLDCRLICLLSRLVKYY